MFFSDTSKSSIVSSSAVHGKTILLVLAFINNEQIIQKQIPTVLQDHLSFDFQNNIDIMVFDFINDL